MPGLKSVSILLACFAGLVIATGVSVMPTRLPNPTGPWVIGTRLLELDSRAPRIVARVWYPAAPGSRGANAPYQYGANGVALRDRLIGAFVLTESLIDVPIRNGPSPVLIYIPGLGGRNFHNSARIQELASHGYVVVALDDTQPSSGFDFTSFAGIGSTILEGDRKVALQARDVEKVIDVLYALNNDPTSFLSKRLALDRLGTIGFSFGGAVAAEVAATDERVRAAIDLDGSVFGTVARKGVAKPFLFATAVSEIENRFEAEFDRTNFRLLERGLEKHGGYVLKIRGVDHYNFSDAGILPSVRHTGVGELNGIRAERIISKYVVGFFDRYLCDKSTPILDARKSVDPVATLYRY